MSGFNKKRNSRSSRGSGSGSSSSSSSGRSGRSGRVVFPSDGGSSRGSITPKIGPLGSGFGSSIPTMSNDLSFNNPYNNNSSSNGAGISRLLDSIQSGGNPLQNLLSLLNNENWDSELWSMFLQFALQQSANNDQRLYDQQLTQDQREYDWNLLQDSRLYNNPQNELARLMGAGISRDAALQLLSGSAGNIGSGGSGSTISNPAPAAPSASGIPGTHNIQIAQTAMQGVQLVANLVGQGIDMATAVSQAKVMDAQASFSKSQLDAFNGVNDITQAFDRAVYDGTLTVEDVQSLRTADDYYKWITDHADTNLVKPLIQNGSVSHAFGTTYGRQMMNNHLQQVREGRDSGKLFDNYVRSTDLANDLSQVNVIQSYQEVSKGIYDILMKEPELLSRWQELMSQAQEYEIRSSFKTQEEYKAYLANKQLQVAQRVFEPASNGGIGSGADSGVELLAFTEWQSLHQANVKALAEHDFGEDYWTKFYQSNVKTAATVQFLKESQAKFAELSLDPNGPNPFFASILNVVKILNESGAWNATDQFFKTADVGLNAFDTFSPVKPQ